MADADMAETVEYLVSRRPKRSTAGNRMEAALAEMALEESIESVEEDRDFVVDKDEEDIFESDFESTDEEAAQEDEASAEVAIQEEERRARKAARSKLERVTAAAHERQKMTFNPIATAAPALKPKESKRRVSLGIVVNAETGEVLTAGHHGSVGKKRHSQRKHTILNTSATVTRMKQSEERKASAPKKAKIESKTFTQAELIARALDNEEGNLVEHRDYLKVEEEKRKRARVVRTAIQGPLVRWISKAEQIRVIVEPPLPPPITTTPRFAPPYSYTIYGNTSGTAPYTQSFNPYQHLSTATSSMVIPYSVTIPGPLPTVGIPTQQELPQNTPPNQRTASAANAERTNQNPVPATSSSPVSPHPQLVIPQSIRQPTEISTVPGRQPEYRTETVTKNYVVHEQGQYDGVSLPQWNQMMTAMFGDHVKWDEVKVYVGKNRPLTRPKITCPITGKPAKYLDPRSGVPYADLEAYQVLTRILNHEYIWDPSIGCYVGKDESFDDILEPAARNDNMMP